MGFLEKYNRLMVNEQDEEVPSGEEAAGVRLSDEELMDMIVNLLISLDEDKLDNDQVDMLFTIMNELDIQAGEEEEEPEEEEEEEVSEIRLLKKTPMALRRKSRMYFKKHKAQIKRKLKKTKKKREMLAKRGRGISGKKLGMTRQR
jgi:hypothetical protein